jgi:hypothetical protein
MRINTTRSLKNLIKANKDLFKIKFFVHLVNLKLLFCLLEKENIEELKSNYSEVQKHYQF